MNADIVFYNGVVYPVIPEDWIYDTLAVRGDKIIFVGSLDSAKSIIGNETKLYDLKGKMLLPGFIDTHAHLLDTGLSEVRLNFGDLKAIEDLIDRIQEKAKETKPGGWIMCGNFDENFILEKRYPTRLELDIAAPDHPVYINHKSYHCSLVNSEALKRIHFDKEIQGVECDFSGHFTSGLLIKEANALMKESIAGFITEIDLEDAFNAVSSIASTVGLTTIHCIEGGAYWSDLYPDFILKAKHKTFDPILYFNTTDIKKIKERNLPRMGGDILVDGSISNRSAALIDAYTDASETYGTLFYSQEELQQLIREAEAEKVQISFHAIGDKAIEEILTAYEQVLPSIPKRDHRHRIEHFGIPHPDHIARAKKLNLALAIQPAFTYQKGSTYLTRLGEERFSMAYPLRDLVSAGICIGGGSDSLVSPLDPIFGIHTAVNAPNIEQRLTIEEAIKLYTIWAASLAFEEEMKGSLQEGKYADFVILEEDIRAVDPSKIKDIKVISTVYRGEVTKEF